MSEARTNFTPMVVLIEGQEWTARSLESVLSPNGWAVLRAYTGRQGLEFMRRLIPDLVLVGRTLSDMTAPQVLQALEELPTVGTYTPKALIATTPLSHDERLQAFEAGAWEILTPPFHSAELSLRLSTWMKAKREADQVRENGMLDTLTGLYNLQGVLRRIHEVVSDASRNQSSVSLVALGLQGGTDMDEATALQELTRVLGLAFGQSTRISDAVARIGPTDFVVVAPNTDSMGAERLADRLLQSASTVDVPVRVGIYSEQRDKWKPVAPLDLLDRATEALRRAQSDPEGPPIFRSDRMN